MSMLSAATHVVFESIAIARLSRLGATHVVRANDSLLIGPAHHDPVEHERIRRRWWEVQEGEQVDLLACPEVEWRPPIVVWVPSCMDRKLNLWRTCKRLRQLRIAARDVRVIELAPVPPLGPREGPEPPFECGESVGHQSDDALLRSFARAQPLSRQRYERFANLWDRFAAPDLRPFVRACLRGVEGFSELAPLWRYLSCFVPRRTPHGVLRMSRFDELLLTALSDSPQTPLAVFVQRSAVGEELRQLGSCTGDLFFPRRLHHWAQHGSMLAVERAPGPTPDNPMKAAIYRIKEHGRELRDKGLDQITDGPELPVAGMTVYSPAAPWVLLENGHLDRLKG